MDNQSFSNSPLAMYQEQMRQKQLQEMLAYQNYMSQRGLQGIGGGMQFGGAQMPDMNSRIGRQQIPSNFDNMVVPPYGLPPDRNTFMPDDLMRYRNRNNQWLAERI